MTLTYDFLDIIWIGEIVVAVWIHPELGVTVQVDGQDWRRREGQDVVTDVGHLGLGEWCWTVVGLGAFVIT